MYYLQSQLSHPQMARQSSPNVQTRTDPKETLDQVRQPMLHLDLLSFSRARLMESLVNIIGEIVVDIFDEEGRNESDTRKTQGR